MARRRELQGISNDLLDSFVSRYNDLNGYWALGKFQSYLMNVKDEELCFPLTEASEHHVVESFLPIYQYYPKAFSRLLKQKNVPSDWVKDAMIKVRSATPNDLICTVAVTTDLGRAFHSKQHVYVLPHDPNRESRTARNCGPQNQMGE